LSVNNRIIKKLAGTYLKIRLGMAEVIFAPDNHGLLINILFWHLNVKPEYYMLIVQYLLFANCLIIA